MRRACEAVFDVPDALPMTHNDESADPVAILLRIFDPCSRGWVLCAASRDPQTSSDFCAASRDPQTSASSPTTRSESSGAGRASFRLNKHEEVAEHCHQEQRKPRPRHAPGPPSACFAPLPEQQLKSAVCYRLRCWRPVQLHGEPGQEERFSASKWMVLQWDLYSVPMGDASAARCRH